MWRSPHRADLESFAGLAISVAGIAAGWIGWVWRARNQQAREVVSGQAFGRLADLLAGIVDVEWSLAAGERGLLESEPIPVRWRRPAAPLTGPVTAAVASTRFVPLPGLSAAGKQRLRAGRVSELYEVYGGLGSGRLVIAGAPGSGKSGAAVLLILAALRHRRSVPEESRSEVPVPVMFTLHGWDPSVQPARDWLAERLSQAYPLFAGRHGTGAARGMLDEGRISVVLDGLDEIPEDLRPTVLRALSKQATFRLVLLTRSAEMGLLAGIVAGGWTGLADYYRIGAMAYLGPGLGAATVAWLGAGLIAGMSRPETDNASPLSPFASRRSDQAFGLMVGLVVWLGVGLAFGLAFGIGTGHLARGLAYGLEGGLVAGLLVGLVYPQSWASSIAFAQLAASDRTPVRLMRFLEDARSRSVLRTVGPVYQFRHARLQDRLADQKPATRPGPGEPRPPTEGSAAPTGKTSPQAAISLIFNSR